MRHLNLRHAIRGNARRLVVFGLLLQVHALWGQILLHDNFMQDSSLDQTLWSTGNASIQAVAQHLTGTLVPPQISFSNSGMTMSGVAKDSQFTGVVSNQNFTPPFAIEFTVNGVVANGNAFWFHMVNSDLSHYLTVYGNVNPQNVPYYALGAESNQASKVLSASPAENVWYTVVLAVDSSGNASASLQDLTGKLLGSTGVGNVGLGPFYLVLGQYEGLPTTVGPNTCTWGQIQVSAGVSGWQLVWSDEFNEAAGTPPNPKNWNYDLGVGKDLWDNSEIDNDTDSPNNVFQDGNGHLVLQAARDSSGNYASARLQTGSAKASTSTANLSWQYGLIEARIKIPSSQGVWPAFRMLGGDLVFSGWPGAGEIDIMENYGPPNDTATVNHGEVQGPGYSEAGGITAPDTLPLGDTVYDDYHVYSLQWSENSLDWFVDGQHYLGVTPSSIPAGDQWVFNSPFFILLNLGIGGPNSVSGTPDPNQPFSNQQMLVDWVRVYQAVGTTAANPVIAPGSVVNGASYLGAIAPGGVATLSGSNLADRVYTDVIDANGNFVKSAGNVTVTVGGIPAALIYVSPSQINFQVPWEVAPGPAVDVCVTRNTVPSQVETVTIQANAAPSMFLEDFTNGVAWMTGPTCAVSECIAQAGGVYQLWANALGPKGAPEQDGVPVQYTGSLAPLTVAAGTSSCQLTVGGQPATILYCGAAPGLIVDQVNFTYPSGVTSTTPYVAAALTVTGVTGHFRLPAPPQ
jgi:uncharacterized protein (TIGR03437 family)